MAKKYYAVKKGLITGIFESWDECKRYVIGFPGAIFKGFLTYEEAENYLDPDKNNSTSDYPTSATEIDDDEAGYIAYVDGSYNIKTGEYSCGVVIINDGIVIEEISQKGPLNDAASMRNVAGEILGSKVAIQYCLDNNIKDIKIYHDYAGISLWPDGKWQAKNDWTQEYARFVQKARKNCNISFIKVKGHSGVKYNEVVDRLAKDVLGID